MKNFEYKNPTKIIFGENTIQSLTKEIPSDAKILMLYGGGSIKKNGIYDQVNNALENHEVIEFGGIQANPEYAILIKALKVIKEENIDFATVLTLPATGSEMNSGAVITRAETKQKLVMGGSGLFPVFSILDPNVVASIPTRQIANGLADSFTHVLEQYMTYPIDAKIPDRIAEGIMMTLIETAPVIMDDPSNYKAAANFMWACTMALNGLIQKGVPTDWAIHMMGHELTALYGIDHARTLAILTESHYTYNFETKKEKLAQYAERVWNISNGTLDEKAKAGIQKTSEFFQSIGINTRLSEYTEEYQGTASIVASKLEERGMVKLGEHKAITPSDVEKIVEMAY